MMYASLYDVTKGCKISEDFHFDLNNPMIRSLLSKAKKKCDDSKESSAMLLPLSLTGIPEEWIAYPKQVRVLDLCSTYQGSVACRVFYFLSVGSAVMFLGEDTNSCYLATLITDENRWALVGTTVHQSMDQLRYKLQCGKLT